jgi:hypothetical protein
LRDGISFSSKAFNRLSASANTLQSLDFKPTIDEWLIDFAMHFFERLCGTLESVQGSIDLSNDIDRRSRDRVALLVGFYAPPGLSAKLLYRRFLSTPVAADDL